MTQLRWRGTSLFWRLIQLSLLVSLIGFGAVGPITPAAAQGALAGTSTAPAQEAITYTNPLQAQIPGGGVVQSCADPSIIRGQTPGDPYWYVYCTTDPLNDNDKNASGAYNFHLIPMLRSLDLAHWTYMGDAFSARPAWAASDAGLWAPDIRYFNNQYYLYFTVNTTSLPGNGSAIGVATAPTPLGPWTDSGAPVVEPHAPPCCLGTWRWVYDPAIVESNGQRYIFYGSYYGGISARTLSADGLHSDPASETQITIDNRYEGSYIIQHGGYFYLFGSATNCCNGPLTGYSVFVGRSQNVLGPYVDKDGISLLASRTGGTVALSMNGNRFVGPGHNAVFTDFAGQDWFVYHAVDQNHPYFDSTVGYTQRPLMMDPLDWVDGWPVVRGGLFASDKPMPAPAAQPGTTEAYRPTYAQWDLPGDAIKPLSDEFNGSTLGPQWSWVRQPAADQYGVTNGSFWMNTQAADLYVDTNNASVLTEPTPSGNYVVETKVRVDVPADGCCYNYVQGGFVIYGNDDNFIKLASVSIWDTRQTEFAKELAPVPAGYPRYGNTVVAAPGEWTWLRIVKRQRANVEYYQAYTSPDGVHWDRGGVWTHTLGSSAKIGLFAMGGSGFTAYFDYVRVSRLQD
jgi:arabinan endo-1,5-alpha-L-arabinosidase